ncbi:MAG: competence/damage-inducible protein A [Microcoleaceae cyanobacterium]
MVAEVICVGTELLLGDILNSNSQYLGQQLAALGIPHYYQSVVGDNPERLKSVLDIATRRSKLLLFTGGLGPTPDDLTVETIADFFSTPLEERSDVLEQIKQRFARRGRTMAPSNRKQALIPKGADVLPNPVGSAPGIIWQPLKDTESSDGSNDSLTIMTFPGVPAEMKAMWQETAIPYLKANHWSQATICSRILRFWGIAESTLAEKVTSYLKLSNPTVAPYANYGEAKLRISARADTEVVAYELIAPVEQQIREITGLDCYGADQDSLASVAGKLLQHRTETLAVAESCTGGGLGQMLTAIPGSSKYFQGGIIAFDNSVKVNLLGVDPKDLESHGAVSSVVAEQMAIGAKSRFNTTCGLSITRIAGPGGGTEAKPVGLVYIGIAGPGNQVEALECPCGSSRGRDWIRRVSACNALDTLRRKIADQQG